MGLKLLLEPRLPGRRNVCSLKSNLQPPAPAVSSTIDLPEETFVHNHNKVLSILLLLLAILLSQSPAFIAVTAGDEPTSNPESSIPTLAAFIETVAAEPADNVTGVYVEDLFALPVVQQPAGQPGYVSPTQDLVTQFGMAERYGNIGLLAHNFAAGGLFFELEEGMEVIIIFGDGSLQRFTISATASYQALEPNNPYSSFRNLTDEQLLSAADLFAEVYETEGLTFQTCIARDNDPSWGRYFVSALPADSITIAKDSTAAESYATW